MRFCDVRLQITHLIALSISVIGCALHVVHDGLMQRTRGDGESAVVFQAEVADNIVMLTEPAVHPIFRANIWYFRGSEMDLVIDTGMGLASLPPVLDLTPGKPVLAVATHAHVDHMGSLYEFTDRAGPGQGRS